MKIREAWAADCRSPPFIPKRHRDGAEIAQNAKDGAPSCTRDCRVGREKPKTQVIKRTWGTRGCSTTGDCAGLRDAGCSEIGGGAVEDVEIEEAAGEIRHAAILGELPELPYRRGGTAPDFGDMKGLVAVETSGIFGEVAGFALVRAARWAGNSGWGVHADGVLREPQRAGGAGHAVLQRIRIAKLSPPEISCIDDGQDRAELRHGIGDELAHNGQCGGAIRSDQGSPSGWGVAIFEIERGGQIASLRRAYNSQEMVDLFVDVVVPLRLGRGRRRKSDKVVGAADNSRLFHALPMIGERLVILAGIGALRGLGEGKRDAGLGDFGPVNRQVVMRHIDAKSSAVHKPLTIGAMSAPKYERTCGHVKGKAESAGKEKIKEVKEFKSVRVQE